MKYINTPVVCYLSLVCALRRHQFDGDAVLALVTSRICFHWVELLHFSDHAVLGHVPHVLGDVADVIQLDLLLHPVVLLVKETEQW